MSSKRVSQFIKKKDDLSGVYSNINYEVLHVYRHISREDQDS